MSAFRGSLERASESDGVSSMTAFGALAIVDRLDLQPGPEMFERLTIREKCCLQTIGSRARRESWLTGRMAAKYLILKSSLQDGREPSSRASDIDAMVRLCKDRLNAFCVQDYASIEILPSLTRIGSAPSLRVASMQCADLRLCLTHCGSISAALVYSGGPAGIDVEAAEPRHDAFYRQQFTQAETDWVDAQAQATGVERSWFFTLLWATKESVIKARPGVGTAIWCLTDLEIRFRTPAVDWAALHGQTAFGSVFQHCIADIRDNSGQYRADVGVTASRQTILTIVEFEEVNYERIVG